MPLVTLPGRSPSGGISQRAPHQRRIEQVQDATNALFLDGEGFMKRPGTLVEGLFAATPNANLRLGFWDIDGSEQYDIVYGAGVLRLFRVGGAEATVTIAGAASTYLALNSASADQMKVRVIGDAVYVVNTTVATGLTTSDSYSVERTRKDYDALVSYSTTVGNSLRTENDSARDIAGYYRYAPGTYTYGLLNLPTVTNNWASSGAYWDDANYYPAGFRVAFRRVNLAGFTAATFTTATGVIHKTGAFSGYTWRAGDMIQISAGTGFTANNWYLITSKTDNDNIVVSGGPGADNANTASNFTDATYGETNRCRIGVQVEVNINVNANPVLDMNEIALLIQRSMRAGGAPNACCAWVPQSAGGNFQITGPFRGDNALVYGPTAPTFTVGANGDLTAAGAPFCQTNMQVFGGTGGAAPDASDTATPESRWTRIAAPGQSGAKIDATKMPVKITRASAGNFNVDPISWDQRSSGDSTNNAAPKLITNGAKIADLRLYRDRLFLIGGPYMAGSVAGSTLNFFKQNAANIVDSDPIDRTISGEVNTSLRELIPFRNALWINSDAGQQWEANADGALTPASLALTATTRYRTIPNVSSSAAAPLLYMVTARQGYAALFEYHYDDLRLSSDAVNVSQEVPRLIPSDLRAMAASVETGVVALVPTTGYRMFIFRPGDRNGRDVQEFWTRYVFDDNYRIADIFAVGGDLRMMVEVSAIATVTAGSPTTIYKPGHGLSTGNTTGLSESTCTPSINGNPVVTVTDADHFTIVAATTASGTCRWHSGNFVREKLPLTPYAADLASNGSAWAYPVHGDRRFTATGVYAAGVTTWTLPGGLTGNGSTLTTIVLGPAFGGSSGNTLTITGYGATTVSIAGDYSAGQATICRNFTLSVTPTRPFATDGTGRPNVADAMMIETLTLRHRDTCAYAVTASMSGTSDRTRSVDFGNTPTTGKLFTLLGGEADAVTHVIADSSVRPVVINGMEVQARLFEGSP